MLTKSDFLIFLDTPLHLWAEHNQRITMKPSGYELQLFEQGREIENLGKEFLQGYLEQAFPDSTVELEKTFEDDRYHARVDVACYDSKSKTYDIYEIKSATSIKKEHEYDIAFQWLAVKNTMPLRKAFFVHLNKDYIRQGKLNLQQLFVVEDVTETVRKLEGEIATDRQAALRVLESVSPAGIPGCTKPESCPCPDLCHPNLPKRSIFDIPRLNVKKARELQARAILSIADLPEDFPLTDNQKRQVQIQKSGKPLIDVSGLRKELAGLQCPLHFLDYETYGPGIPWFDGYKPYHHIVFQYSLHVASHADQAADHHEFLATGRDDPTPHLLAHLVDRLPDNGSVIVWNKTFETSRNTEMGDRYPKYRRFLEGVNQRVYDLMDIFEKGYFIHPDFRGSVSLKKVFPVLVPDGELSFADLPISSGDAAMITWLTIVSGRLPAEEAEEARHNLMRYCELDTSAMLQIWMTLKHQVDANEGKWQ